MKIFSMWLVAVVLLTASIGNAQTYSPIYSTDLIFKDGANFLTLTPTGLSATFTLTLPTTNGTTGQVLGLTGANALGWFTPIVSGVTAAGGDLTGTYPNPDIAAGAIINADVNAAAAIAYSKLSLTNSIVTGDLVDDNVTLAKIANAAANDVLVGSGNAGSGANYTEITLGSTLAMSGTVLGLNLANANTWTATQTLPTTAAQGDALIASVNAGTTTIDAARIGAGLTDAQVNDNLTINGGTIDATPIGATTESTGRFSTVEATTVLGAATTPAAGTYYRDNATIAWGDIAAAGTVNDQFGNFAVVHTPGTGVYTVTLPNAPTAAATVATLQSLGFVTVTRAGAVLTITTYDTTGTPTDLDYYFITTGRP